MMRAIAIVFFASGCLWERRSSLGHVPTQVHGLNDQAMFSAIFSISSSVDSSRVATALVSLGALRRALDVWRLARRTPSRARVRNRNGIRARFAGYSRSNQSVYIPGPPQSHRVRPQVLGAPCAKRPQVLKKLRRASLRSEVRGSFCVVLYAQSHPFPSK